MSAPAATVDSLVKFSYKKKFSFTNRKPSVDEQPPGDEDGGANELHHSTESASAGGSDESFEPATVIAKAQHKGSARLKESGSESSGSSSDSGPKKSKNKKKKDAAKPKKKQRVKRNDDSDETSEDEDARKVERQLGQLYKMFPSVAQSHIKQMYIKRDFDAKSCIDTLLEEVNGGGDKKMADEDEIEEWSDGDAEIKAKNEQARAKKLAAQASSGAPPVTDQQVKRKSNDDLNREPLKKKARKLVILSDDEDEVESTSVKSKQSSASSLNSLASSGAELVSKKAAKKSILRSSSDQDEEEEERSSSKKSKKHKKEKKKHKKSKKSRDDEEAASDQSDNEFARRGADYDTDDSADEEEKMTDEEKAAILSMLNDASSEDIQSMINISAKRLSTLMSLRPFKNYEDLHQRLSKNSLYPTINTAKEIIYARSIVSNMLSKCEKISQKMQTEVASLIESSKASDNSKTSLEIKFQPKILNKNLSLKPYQLIGLNWLCLMHKENINGILADEMGLGKTCQTISFLAHLLETNKKMMHLIIVPPSTLDNWVREITTWCPSFYFTVYQGSLEERRRLRFDILNNRFEQPLNGVLTTYGLISSTNEDKAFFKKLPLEYCVFDEAHMLKNMNSQRYQSLIQIKSKRKLLLTGTPLQNNLVELMSLLYFVMPNMFQNQTEYINKIFAAKPANVDKDTFYNEKIAQAKGIMAPFILRRLKTDVLKQLPKKVEEVIKCEMTQKQQKEYTALVNYYKQRKDELELLKTEKSKKEAEIKDEGALLAMDAGSASMSTSTLFKRKAAGGDKNGALATEDSSSNILMELRKAANHPLLRRCIYDNDKIKQMANLVMKESSPDTVYDYVVEDLSVMSDFQIHKICPLYRGLKSHALDNAAILNSGKFVILDSLLAEKKEMGDRVLLFSQFVIMLDIVEEFLKIKGYKYFRLDGSTAVNERQDMIDCFNNDPEVFIFLLSTKAGGVGINLTAANVVIMHDIDFNPFNDKQAEDRCHRVGQTREVQVYKLISKNSIDETMLKIQKVKLDLGADMSGSAGDQTTSKADMVSMLKEALKL